MKEYWYKVINYKSLNEFITVLSNIDLNREYYEISSEIHLQFELEDFDLQIGNIRKSKQLSQEKKIKIVDLINYYYLNIVDCINYKNSEKAKEILKNLQVKAREIIGTEE